MEAGTAVCVNNLNVIKIRRQTAHSRGKGRQQAKQTHIETTLSLNYIYLPMLMYQR